MLRSLFPTQIWHSKLGNTELCDALAATCWVLSDEDEAGNQWCDSEGYDGYTSYASLNDLPERFPDFAALKQLLDAEAAKFADALEWDLSERALKLDALWVNILGEGGSHSGHIHPGSVISGTFYVAVPEGAGLLKLEDPRLGLMMAAPAPVDQASDDARRFIYHTPETGHVLLWESWLRHEVMPNNSEDARISISFNYALTDISDS
ncbi:MAG: TIGR02466 family protein [Hyphomonas sp.]